MKKINYLILAVYVVLFLSCACGHGNHSRQADLQPEASSKRGDIFDCEGKLVATSELVYDVHLDCKQLESWAEWDEKTLALAPRLAALLPERGAAEWWDYLQNGRRQNKRYLCIAKAITKEKKDSLARLPIFDLPRFIGGVIYGQNYIRRYPYGGLAKRVIGHALPRDNGHVGIEGKFDKFLKETDVQLTIAMDMQSVADSALRAAIEDDKDIEAGCVVLMDVHSGAIRAMVNQSRRGDTDELWESYNDAIAHSYEPGEILQTMTLASVLRDGYVRSLSRLEDFSINSHEVMSKLALDYYDDAKVYYTKGLQNLCLPKRMNFDIDGLREVDITNPNGYYWMDYTLSHMANGLCITMTPLDVLSFYNTIANNGQMIRPYLVECVGREGDKFSLNGSSPVIIRESVLTQSVTDTLIVALQDVVENGSGRLLKDAKHTIAAKTGSAKQILRPDYDNGQEQNPYQDNEGRYQTAATCAGFFPAVNPQYSIICVIFSRPCLKEYSGDAVPTMVVKDIINNLTS